MSKGKYVKKKERKAIELPIPGWAIIAAIVLFGELLLHVWTVDELVFGRLLSVLTFALAFGGLTAFLVSLVPPKAEKWVVIILSAVLAVLYLMEYFIYDAYKYFMPLSVVAAGAAGVATGFTGTVLQLLGNNLWRILLFILPIVAYGVFTKPRKNSWTLRGILAAVAVVMYLVSFGVINFVTDEAGRLNKDYNFTNAINSFGLNMAFPLEAINSANTQSGPSFELPEETLPPATVAPTEAETEPENTDATEPEETEPIVYEPNVLDVDFAALAAEEKNPYVAQIHTYVASKKPTMQNEYTGLFEGKNLIFLTAEAFCSEFLSPELTPTLWRMANEGIKFTDYYQPVWGAGTTGGEYSNLVGLMPTTGDCMMETREQTLFQTMGHQLQKLGYSSAAYHNNDHTFYSRHLTHELLGYDYFMGYGNGMEEGITKCWPQSDLEMIDYTLPMHLDSQPFNLYYMTVSGHSTYFRASNAMSEKNYHLVKDLPNSEPVKCYIACNLELEFALASLLEQLEAAGIADDTVIVVAADHYPYGLAPSDTWETERDYLYELYGESWSRDHIRDRNTLIIWSGCIEDMDIVVDTPVYSLDILPTLSNLFGVEYDSRLMIGRDVFSDQEPLVFWPTGSWKTAYGRYDATSGKFTPVEGVQVPDGYVEQIRSLIRNHITYSRSVAGYNYFNYIIKAMEAMEEPTEEATEEVTEAPEETTETTEAAETTQTTAPPETEAEIPETEATEAT